MKKVFAFVCVIVTVLTSCSSSSTPDTAENSSQTENVLKSGVVYRTFKNNERYGSNLHILLEDGVTLWVSHYSTDKSRECDSALFVQPKDTVFYQKEIIKEVHFYK